MANAAPSTELHELVRRRLAENDIRYTSGRQTVITSIQLATGPRTAAEFASGADFSLPLSSLYRTLSIFEDNGILRKHHGADGLARYELAEWLSGHHHHVICVKCGAMEDIDISEAADQDIHALIMSLGASSGFRVLDHVIEVEGVCHKCDTPRNANRAHLTES